MYNEIFAFMQGIEAGIFESVTEKDLPNLAKMYDFAKIRDKGAAIEAGVPAVLYHEGMFKKAGWAPPKGFADLERPEFKGKIVLPPVGSSFGLYLLIELARLHGGSEKNIEPGFAALKAMAPGVVDWIGTYARIGEMLEGQEAAITVWGTAGAWEIIDKGVPAKLVPPDPVYLQMSAVGVIKGSPNPVGARVLANWMMGPRHLGYRAEHYGENPLNREVKPTGGNVGRMVSEEGMKHVVNLDYEYILKHRAEWIDRFKREIERR
jgi:putative spermidine/putrescine transport system substrate-binding protein